MKQNSRENMWRKEDMKRFNEKKSDIEQIDYRLSQRYTGSL